LDDPQISNYIAENNVTTTDLFEQFSVKAHGYAIDDGKEVMIWEDGVTTLGIQFNTSTILQVWLSAANVKLGASLGYRIVASPYQFWYLDCGHGGWVRQFLRYLRNEIADTHTNS
jgi:hexosaminidase